jgi:NTP pyrophosphatase (non-canonical NTP hydrolase)
MDHPALAPQPTLQDLQQYVGKTLIYRGFEDQTAQDELLMLCEEVGELAKALRQHQNKPKAVDSQSFEVAYEIADVLWVLACIANRLGVDLETALRAKDERNKQRTWKRENA